MARYIHSGDQVKSEQIKAAASGTKGRPDDKSESSDELGALLKQGQSFPQAGAGPSAAESGGEESGRDVHPSYADSSGGPAEGTADAENSKQADIGVDAGVTGYSGHDLQPSDGAGTPDQEGAKAEDTETQAVSGAGDTGAADNGGGEPQDAQQQEDTEESGESEGSDESNEPADTEEKGGGLKGFLSTLFGDESDPAEASGTAGSSTQDSGNSGNQDAEASNSQDAAAANGQQETEDSGPQDSEISSELGTEEPESGKKGFFARLFGEEPDEEDEDGESEAEQGMKADKRQSQAGEKAKKPRKQAAEPQEKKDDPLQKKRDSERSDSLEQSIIYWQGNDKIPERLEDTKKTLTEVLGLGSSFDIVFREMTFGGRKAALLCISGFAKDTIIDEILKRLTYLTPDEVSTGALSSFMTEYIPHIQVEKGELLSESINKVLSGMSVFFIEGEDQVIIMDTRAYPARGPDEPSIERVVRGARDGFTETLLSNVALVRRRLRDPGLKYEMHQVGRRTRTDVCVAYIDDIVDKTQVQAVTDKIKSIDIDGIPLADKQLEEAIVGRGWNPYPLVRYSERPDTVASHLLEGRVVIFVDTSPSVIVLPTTFFDLCQHAEENRQTPFMGTYLRWVRFIGVFASMFLLPLWMLMVIHPELKPAMLEFIGPQKMAKIPILAQFLIVELGVDLLRMAAVHTPTPLGSAMGLIAAILVGDIAVQTGLFVNEVVLYMAVASIGMFATPSYELGLANRIVRLALLLAVAAFQVQGFMIGSTLLVILLTTHRSYNSSYLWPFIPFNAKAMGAILVRQPVLSSKARPSFNKTRDNTRMPPVQENEK